MLEKLGETIDLLGAKFPVIPKRRNWVVPPFVCRPGKLYQREMKKGGGEGIQEACGSEVKAQPLLLLFSRWETTHLFL